jgi:hypothetical protein
MKDNVFAFQGMLCREGGVVIVPGELRHSISDRVSHSASH